MSIIEVKNYKGVEVERVKKASSAEKTEIRMKDAIINKVLEANDIEVPQNLIDDEVTMMVIEMNHKMKYESMATGRDSGLTQDDIAELMKNMRQEAFELVKTKLVLKGIMEAENFEVTKEELDEEAKAISVRQQMTVKMVKDFLGEDLESLKDDLLIRKTIDFICVNAVIK